MVRRRHPEDSGNADGAARRGGGWVSASEEEEKETVVAVCRGREGKRVLLPMANWAGAETTAQLFPGAHTAAAASSFSFPHSIWQK
jgi:hypothetical protein